jgi:hypothetical protein
MKFFSGKRAVMVFLAVAAVMLLPLAGQATTFSFQGLQTTPATISTQSIAIGESQFKVEIFADTDPLLLNYVDFKISNSPTSGTFQTSSITEAYFWDGQIFTGAYKIGQSSGVNFIAGGVAVAGTFAAVAGLPDAALCFTFDGFGSTPPTSHNGVDSNNEFVTLKLQVNPSGTMSALDTVLAEIGQWGGLGSSFDGATMLAMGLKGQAFGKDALGKDYTSADFVINPNGTVPPPVPVPPTVWLMGSGMVGLALLGWRRRKQ